jgi:NAD(P)-dependent dehydrogenase (short-subunit alcohol dehydrogenase family)
VPSLKDRTVLVIGRGSGIARAIALAVGEEGGRVIAAGRHPEDLDRRFDYVLSAWPRRGGAGYPVRCQRLGVLPADRPQLSDHYGVLADLRY